MLTRRVAILCTVALASGACAAPLGGVDPYSLFLRPWSPPSGQSCEVEWRDADPDRIINTATALRTLPPAPPGSVVFSGALPDTLRVLESTLPDSVTSRIRERLLPLVRFYVAPRFFIRLDFGGPTRIRLAPGLECIPAPRNPDDARRLDAQYRGAGLPGRGVIHLVIDPAGSVQQATLTATTGDTAVDRAILGLARQIQFWPGLMNRFPIGVSINWPLPVIR